MIHVVIGVIFNSEKEVLIAQRPLEALGGGKWEFPGGKVESGESGEQALVRELEEEVGIHATSLKFMTTFHYDYPDRSLKIDVWQVHAFSGTAHGREGQPIKWVTLSELTKQDMLPANKDLIVLLQS